MKLMRRILNWFSSGGVPYEKPVSCSEFRKKIQIYFLVNTFVLAVLGGSYWYGVEEVNHDLQRWSLVAIAVSQIIVGLASFFEIRIDLRLQEIFPEEKRISPLVNVSHSMLPVFNVPLLGFLLLKKKSIRGRGAPLILRSPFWASSLVLIVVVLQLGLSRLAVPRSFRALSYWMSNPATNVVLRSLDDARWILSLKEENLNKTTEELFSKISQGYSSDSLDSTGHILSVAVLASNLFKNKHDRTRGLELVEYLIRLEQLRAEQPLFMLRFNPFVILSQENLIELSLLTFIENDIEMKFDLVLSGKIDELLTKYEDSSAKKGHEDKAIQDRVKLARINFNALQLSPRSL